ncbi:MAG: dTMP kinase [Candidatus Sericytochromatia bacterium]
MPNLASGCFITFEGGEGAGKSTQLARLHQWLEAEGRQVLITRQPGGTGYGQRIRQLILSPNPEETLSARAELFLYLADRAQHVDTVIRPALAAGQVVLCDRYTDSTLAYQGYGRQLDLVELKTLNQLATNGLQPDLTIWLDLDPDAGRARILRREALDRLEAESLAFHERVRTGYASLAAAEPERWLRLDASQPEAALFDQIQQIVGKHLNSEQFYSEQ